MGSTSFLSVMSHELRTPLNGVLGFSELLNGSPLNDEQKGFVRTISSSGEHLLAIVNDVLDFASIEKGTLALQAAPFAIAELVKEAEAAVHKSAADKGLEFRCETAPGVPEHITGDVRRIRQILINLLGNAVKFTSKGSAVLRVAPASAEGRPALDFSVEDTGIGISSETLDRLFKPFTQEDSTRSRAFGGTGLGLVISKRLAEAMGGSITVASAPGKGSTFTFRLPTGGTGAPPVAAKSIAAEKIAAGLVLVVDDDPNSSKLAGKMIESLGCRVAFATDGLEAVAAFAPGKFSAILMDVWMPVMDGLEATRKIRGAEATAGGRVPIIALTANVLHGVCASCLAAGMDDFLSKPFKREELAAKLSRARDL
ncbi:MAG: ATP-binding protein [Verrucomicrobiae bacterium]